MNEEVFVSELSRKAAGLSVEEQVIRETDEKIFARTCQLIDKYGTPSGLIVDGKRKVSLAIPFDTYDSLADYAEHIADEFPDIFDTEDGNEVKQRAVLTRLLEAYYKDNITEVQDFMGAVINKNLCVSNKIRTYEDEKNKLLIVEMLK